MFGFFVASDISGSMVSWGMTVVFVVIQGWGGESRRCSEGIFVTPERSPQTILVFGLGCFWCEKLVCLGKCVCGVCVCVM